MARLFFAVLLALLFSIVASLVVPNTAGLPQCILDSCSLNSFILYPSRLQCTVTCSFEDKSAATSWLLSIRNKAGVLAPRSGNETASNSSAAQAGNQDTQNGSTRISSTTFIWTVFCSSLGCFAVVVAIFERLGKKEEKPEKEDKRAAGARDVDHGDASGDESKEAKVEYVAAGSEYKSS